MNLRALTLKYKINEFSIRAVVVFKKLFRYFFLQLARN